MIIWDEYKYGKNIYESSNVKTKKWQLVELKCLIKYLLENKYNPKDIRVALFNCCQEDLKYLPEKYRNNIFNKLIQQCKKSKIIKNKEIIIYNDEMDIIKSIDDLNKEKVLFVLLVYNKWLNNHEWFSMVKRDIFKTAKINLNSKVQQNILFDLLQKGFLKSEVRKIAKGSKKNKQQMWNLSYLRQDGDIAFVLSDYDNLIYRYLNYFYEGYFECITCKHIFKKNNNKQKYCYDCAKLAKNLQNKQYKNTK